MEERQHSSLPYKLPQCSEHPDQQVTLICSTSDCQLFTTQKLFCKKCNDQSRHLHVGVEITKEIARYQQKWEGLISRYDISHNKIDSIQSDYQDIIKLFGDVLKEMKKESKFHESLEFFEGYRNFLLEYYNDVVVSSIQANDIIKLSNIHEKEFCRFENHFQEKKLLFLQETPIIMLWNFYYDIIEMFNLQQNLDALCNNSLNCILRFKVQKIQQQIDVIDALKRGNLQMGPLKLNMLENKDFNPIIAHNNLLSKLNSLLPTETNIVQNQNIERLRSELDTVGNIALFVSQRDKMAGKVEKQTNFFKEKLEEMEMQARIFRERQEEHIQKMMKKFEEHQLDQETQNKTLMKQIEEQTTTQLYLETHLLRLVDTKKFKLDGTKIILTPIHLILMMGYFQEVGKPNQRCNLIYQATRDGFGSSDFHKACDNKGPTLTIIQTDDDHIIGGYTNEHWESTFKCKADATSWLFTISHPHPFKSLAGGKGIWCNQAYGPYFGYDDLVVDDNSNLSSSSSAHLEATSSQYQFCCGIHLLNGKGKTNFKTKEIEVYSVTTMIFY
ncbi:hypothetical protein FGO68_gene6173 [Halteria grandinella]|uniref:TLDc domain-containing protein n=1 Tax=Halteria grandinella TaxID=5974 RepID=A0A8J8NV29_HALGN|nr:hypothetical protein FGO68_gene6173 [Halteria grandinella]